MQQKKNKQKYTMLMMDTNPALASMNDNFDSSSIKESKHNLLWIGWIHNQNYYIIVPWL